MDAPRPPKKRTRQAIETLRQLIELATEDLERALGGPLTFEMVRLIRNWVARAFEAGQRDGRTRPPDDPGSGVQ